MKAIECQFVRKDKPITLNKKKDKKKTHTHKHTYTIIAKSHQENKTKQQQKTKTKTEKKNYRKNRLNYINNIHFPFTIIIRYYILFL